MAKPQTQEKRVALSVLLSVLECDRPSTSCAESMGQLYYYLLISMDHQILRFAEPVCCEMWLIGS